MKKIVLYQRLPKRDFCTWSSIYFKSNKKTIISDTIFRIYEIFSVRKSNMNELEPHVFDHFTGLLGNQFFSKFSTFN